MKEVRSTVIVTCLVFLLSLSAVGCARQNTDKMSENSMETTMDSMNEEKMDSTMEKSMDTIDAEKMDDSMKKDIQHDMK